MNGTSKQHAAELQTEKQKRELNQFILKAISEMDDWNEIVMAVKAMKNIKGKFKNEMEAIKGRNYIS